MHKILIFFLCMSCNCAAETSSSALKTEEDRRQEKNDNQNEVKKRTLPDTSIRDRESLNDYFLEMPFFRLPAFSIPILKEGVLVATLYVRFECETASKDFFNIARVFMPRIADQIFLDFYNTLSILWFVEDPINPQELASRAKRVMEHILGEKAIKNIFVRDFYLLH